ncbi:UDP binding domain-containing protein [Acinetobacter radioresistens]|uniref:UDP binding domain-containing protein n=1 Tax=Acinetobacter radioresistens TaxID=40216 RepID=UPI0032B44865
MKIAVFGATLQAAVMSALWAETGHQVYWCQGLEETCAPGLTLDTQLLELLSRQKHLGNLKETSLSSLKEDIDVYFFGFNPSCFQEALDIVQHLSRQPIIHPKLMINGSTFGLKGTASLQKILAKDAWVYLPDMIQEGKSAESFTHSREVVIGIDEKYYDFAQTQTRELLRPFFPLSQQYLFMPILDAEFTKLSISGMLATRISYMNDLAQVAEKLHIDIENVRLGLGADSRIGSSYLQPGVGFGGDNFSRDILTLSETMSSSGTNSRLLQQVWEINEQQKEILFRKLWNYYCCDLQSKTVAIWGAAFKENTSSTINSPVHTMLEALWAQQVTVKLHDPAALPDLENYYGKRKDLILCRNPYEAVQDAHALCLMTAWKAYWSPDYSRLKQLMAHPMILDGRNIYDPAYVRAQGFAYEGVGRI